MKFLYFIFILSFIMIEGLYSQEQNNPEQKGKVLVEAFVDYFYKINGEAAPDSIYTGGEYQRNENKSHGMAFRRFNFGYEYKFNDKFNARVMLEGNDGFTNNGTRSVYIKYAFLEWNLFKSTNLVIGAQSTPTFATFSEKYWGYRSVEKTIIDFRRDGSSNDVGIGLNGNLNKAGTLGYTLMVGNGSSTKIEDNNFKRIYGTVYGKILDKKVGFQLYSDYEGAKDNVKRYLLKAFLAYEHKRFTIGVEPYNRITTDSTESVQKSTFGIQLFTHGSIVKDRLNAFYRIDFYDNDRKKDYGYRETFMVFGLDYSPFKNINIIPNVWINGYNPEESIFPDRRSDVVARMTVRFKI